MTDKQLQPGQHHPEEYQQDLNPNEGAGQNNGLVGDQAEQDARTAYDIKHVHDMLNNMTDDTLRQIPILPTGTRLQQGATYVDLQTNDREPFKARGDQEVKEHNLIVPKQAIDYQLWNELIGVTDSARLGESDEA
ncbi:MAG: hypothetical protein H7Z42_00985 [Roseiflexaceae bacterium]|nr:hypothetical protein [Roseiflexaceae bacterium]